MSLLNRLKLLRVSDLRGLAQLATQATSGVTRIAEGVHHAVLDTMGFRGSTVPGQTRGLTGLVYRSVHGATQVTGKSIDLLLAGLQTGTGPVANSAPDTLEREAVLAALNGVIGDHLAASKNVFAIPMSLRYQGEALNWQALPSVPAQPGKLLILMHGLCMNDLQRHAARKNHAVEQGAALAAALGYTPLYLRYNSGLHISLNGRELSVQLEQLLTHWPAPIDEITIVAHSMGGLLARSACHYARQDAMRWPDYLKSIVFLGTPHHGAPLERAGNWVDVLLGGTSYTRPFAALGQLRSAGITDLRYGYVVDEDWQGHDRFHRKADSRQHVCLPEGVACYLVAATTADRRSALAGRLIGDGLVPLNSALGYHDDAGRRLPVAQDAQWIVYRTSHLELLSSPAVTRQIVQWLKPEQSQDNLSEQRHESP
jgi:pimeloyl-ACP methyl ester carboxylesterase